MSVARLPDSYFEKIYAGASDPWGFATRAYERRKYDLTLERLPRARYTSAFEPGCAIGVLSERLAARCDRLVATEPIARVAALARERLRASPGASVVVGAIPEIWPTASFDLVVLSEVLYYLTPEGLEDVLGRLDASLVPGGHVVAVHYRLETDYPLTGDDVHARLARHAAAGYEHLATHREKEFQLDVYERTSAR